MDRRIELHEKLCSILGSNNVYFQPPESLKIKYPAIVYSFDGYIDKFADNHIYHSKKSYQITYISKQPDSPVTDELKQLEYIRFSRRFVSDNLYHDVFELYF